MIEWISVNDKLPPYGDPVLLCSKFGTVQNVTYCLDGDDDVPDWFEPYHFEHDDNCKTGWNMVSHWAAIPEPPTEVET